MILPRWNICPGKNHAAELGQGRDPDRTDSQGAEYHTPNQADLVFTVSVQGHGKYPLEPVLENP
jgi:hypothetical protein